MTNRRRAWIAVCCLVGCVALLIPIVLWLDEASDARRGSALDQAEPLPAVSPVPADPQWAVEAEVEQTEQPMAESLGRTTVKPVEISRAVTLVGRVLDSQSRWLPDAHVALLPSTEDLARRRDTTIRETPDVLLPEPRLEVRTRTDEDGMFRLLLSREFRSPGDPRDIGVPVQLLVWNREHALRLVTVDWYGEQETHVPDTGLEAQIQITGRVVDSIGTILQGVDVRPAAWIAACDRERALSPLDRFSAEQDALISSLLAVETDQFGEFTLKGLRRCWIGQLELNALGAVPNRSALLQLAAVEWELQAGELVLPLDRRLSGIVVDVAMEPIADALVVRTASSIRASTDGTLHGELRSLLKWGSKFAVLTDDEGRFDLAGLARPVYRLYVASGEHGTVCIDRAVPGRDPERLRIILTARPPARLAVMDSHSKSPLPIAVVRVQPVSEADALFVRRDARRVPVVRTADRPGEWWIEGGAPGDIVVQVECKGYVAVTRTLAECPLDRFGNYILALDSECVVAGRISNAGGGGPLAGVHVTVRSSTASKSRSAVTNSAGEYRVVGLATGVYRVVASAAGFMPGSPPEGPVEFKSTGEFRQADVRLMRGGNIRGRLRYVGGHPAPGRLVQCLGETTQTARDGGYLLTGLMPGRWVVTASPGGEVAVLVVAGETVVANLEIPELCILSGTVTQDGHPVPAVVELLDRESRVLEEATANERGEYDLRTYETGSLNLRAGSEWGARGEAVMVYLKSGMTSRVDLEVEGSSLSGRVVDGGTGRGVADVVVIAGYPQRWWPRGRGGRADRGVGWPTWTATTDAQGAFSFPLVSPSTLELRVDLPRRRTLWWDVPWVKHGVQRPEIELVLEPLPEPAGLEGVLFHPDGGLVFDGTTVAVVRADQLQDLETLPKRLGGLVTSEQAVLAATANGQFTFSDLTPGEYGLVHLAWVREGRKDWVQVPTMLRKLWLYPEQIQRVELMLPVEEADG